MHKRLLSVAVCVVLLLSVVAGLNPMSVSIANAETESGLTHLKIKDGMTQPIYSREEAIVEHLYVETTVDSDQDGEFDRVSIKVMRPNSEPGVKVPVIYEMSPYRAGLNFPLEFYDVDRPLTPVDHPGYGGKPFALTTNAVLNLGYLGNYYVPRGYAVILGESIGSGDSEGCATTGDEQEKLAAKAVIDWLNDRANAFTEDGAMVTADWTTGNVGMIGVSYNGTLPNAVATTGVEGLKTIVPISAISSWYDYYRANGAVVAPGGYQGEDTDVLAKAVTTRDNPEVCQAIIEVLEQKQDRATGDYNEFWDHRNYVNDAENIEASVLVVHGLNDWNVKTEQFAQWWDALEKYDVPRKMWLHQGGHGGTSENNWKQTENRWFAHWLYGIDNGIMDEPMIDIEREDGSWEQEANWPNNNTENTTIYIEETRQGTDGTLRTHPVPNRPDATQMFVDDSSIRANTLVANPELDNENRLAYLSPELKDDTRISGTPEVSIRASLDQSVANLTALLVDYGGERPEIVTRGWMDPQNLKSSERSKALVPGREYTFSWNLQPDDYIFEKGHRLGVVIIASDYHYTLRPEAGTKITIKPTKSNVTLPIVGGKDAIGW
ncbi:Xaa-Pro dipeptidyl-peptidase [Alkalihalobacillus sp. AL-G]|uniref:Xaa-Pro dipeptidyl-peptidase n=1 Tax=Alkalihalobacillus sp. AL-G TaxID=2926399 RepID=UPI00272AE1EB|nr:Xaa-Pro dipeptidyl-peptidase [Alkalihalobacillus sp. AL-G]WLD94459.1 Xaa-Pro dipeptidyl-peptidase [Alkalihalobacillus sp. AL-G]